MDNNKTMNKMEACKEILRMFAYCFEACGQKQEEVTEAVAMAIYALLEEY